MAITDQAKRVFFVLAVSLASVPQARAHAILMDSQPAAQARVPAGEVTFRLRYNSRIDRARSRFVMIHDGREATVAIAPDGPADILAARAAVTPGAWVLRWQVLAIDGHITRGDLPFTVLAK